ncbi:MAG: fluoride efflux transporter FluC [Rhodoglobus sp.]
MTAAVIATVIVAGALAAAARFLVAKAFANSRFPWAVLVVNVVASGIGGAVLALAERADVSDDMQLILLTGLCGGLSTFSTLSVETIQFVVDGEVAVAVRSVIANLVLGIAAAAAAYGLVLLLG